MKAFLDIIVLIIQIGIASYTVLFLCKLFRKENYGIVDYLLVILLSTTSTIFGLYIKSIIPLCDILIVEFIAFISYKYILKQSTVKSIFLVLLNLICITISQLISYIYTSITLNSHFTILANNTYNAVINVLLQAIAIIIFTNVFKIILKRHTNLSKLIDSITLKQLIIFIISLIICVCPQLIIFALNKYTFRVELVVINCIQIIISCIFIIAFMSKTLEKNKAEVELVTAKLHNETMSGMVDGLRTLKHDFNNIIQSLSSYSKAKEFEKLDDYINKLLKEFKVVNTLGVIDPEIFNESAIYGIVGSKYFLVTSANIPMDIEVFTVVNEINFPMPELSRILGILLDNAYEATKKCDNPYIRLEMKYDNRKCADVIRVINTYNTDININFEDIYKKGVSSKKVKSGIGLWEVKKIISKFSHAQIYPSINKDKFIQNIIIEKNV